MAQSCSPTVINPWLMIPQVGSPIVVFVGYSARSGLMQSGNSRTGYDGGDPPLRGIAYVERGLLRDVDVDEDDRSSRRGPVSPISEADVGQRAPAVLHGFSYQRGSLGLLSADADRPMRRTVTFDEETLPAGGASAPVSYLNVGWCTDHGVNETWTTSGAPGPEPGEGTTHHILAGSQSYTILP